MPKVRWHFTINGTAENPWHRYGLRQNPFPQHERYEMNVADFALQSLGDDPITSAADIRERLKGALSETFIDSVVARYVPGAVVQCDVTCEW